MFNNAPVFSKGVHNIIISFSRKLLAPPTIALFCSGKEVGIFSTSQIDEMTYSATVCIENSMPDGIAILKPSGTDENGLEF